MKQITIIYASHDGQTKKISTALATHLNDMGSDCTLHNVTDIDSHVLQTAEIVVLGSPIRYGKHLPEMVEFIQNNRNALDEKVTSFFSVNLTARKANRSTPETSNYLKKLFEQLDWQPSDADVFAGKLDYPSYKFFDKQMIRFIMWITKGPTDANTTQEFTDWSRVEAFAQRLAGIAHK